MENEMKVRNLLYLLTSFLLTSTVVCAQDIPTRNRAKDKKEISVHSKIGKNNPQLNKGNSKKRNSQKKRKSAKTAPVPLYVYINGKSQEETTINYSGGTAQYFVDSNIENGLSYGFFYPENDELKPFDPSWLHFQDVDEEHFNLTFDYNDTYESRGALFLLGNPENVEATAAIFIMQNAKPITASGKIVKATLRHNVLLGNGKKYLEINADVSLQNARNLNFVVGAILQDEDGAYIPAKWEYPMYRTEDGTLIATHQFTSYSDTYRGNVTIQIPNDAMILWKNGNKHKLHCQLFIHCVESNEIIKNSEYSVPLNTKEKKKEIITEDR